MSFCCASIFSFSKAISCDKSLICLCCFELTTDKWTRKTTIANIISGFYAKDSGNIFYNNINIDELNKQSLRENIFLVLQMPILFNNTLRFNLTMGEDISNEKIKEALKISKCSLFLQYLTPSSLRMHTVLSYTQ